MAANQPGPNTEPFQFKKKYLFPKAILESVPLLKSIRLKYISSDGTNHDSHKRLLLYQLEYYFVSALTGLDHSETVLLLWIICVISVLFLLCFRARLFIGVLWSPAGKG